MPEPFGIVASALSVAGLFNNCVACFEYVQLGRPFGRDYERCQLRLDIAKARLSRWGEAVKINDDPRFHSSMPTDKSVQLAQSIVEEILLLFESAQKTSKRYELVADQQDLVVFEDKDMTPIGRALHRRLKDIVSRRQKVTSLAKKTAWALYDGKSLEKIVDQVAGFVDELEKAFPIEAVCHKLAEIEIEEVEDEASLTILKDAAGGIDAAMSDAAAQKIDAIVGRNSAKDIRTEERARVQLGNVVTAAALHGEIRISDQTTNSVETVVGKGESRVLIGNEYGGKGFWDDNGR
ncbi:Heterokaryon incompatibility protein S [Podospora bellae-mahoneyi]|uniref:Heterokaryon incompatibility protein S n=1 Tax=Podospora bellae-mahoneyi TaxID=2093777 RepID=A0ABR0FJI4_9PEZI|nr:Heterokaryon incompatibility protein S [Podospora bellae-mahoneyi]